MQLLRRKAFHLFASTHAAGEIARVLRPGGVLTLMWNLPAGPIEPPITAVDHLLADRGPDPGTAGYDPADLDPRRYASGDWRLPVTGSQFGGFQEVSLPSGPGRACRVPGLDGLDRRPSRHDALPLLHQIRSLLPAADYRRPWLTRIHWTQLEAHIRRGQAIERP